MGLSLLTQDIAGALSQRYIGECPYHIYQPRHEKSKPILNITNHDIPGAQVNTLKQGFVHQRGTNPLNPSYRFLDGTMSKWGQVRSPPGRVYEPAQVPVRVH